MVQISYKMHKQNLMILFLKIIYIHLDNNIIIILKNNFCFITYVTVNNIFNQFIKLSLLALKSLFSLIKHHLFNQKVSQFN